MPAPSGDAKLLGAALRASQALDMGRFVEVCVEGIGGLIDSEAVYAYLRGGQDSDLELRATWTGKSRESVRRPPALLDRAHVEAALAAGGRTDPRAFLRRGGAPWPEDTPGSVRLAGIGAGEKLQGAFVIVPGRANRALSEEDEETLAAFMAAIDPVLRNIAMVEELKETSLRDDIAACYNRRYFDVFLGEEIARAKRFRSQVSILFMDMDNLKQINSAHGHAMGSRTLLEVSMRVNGGIRKIDKLFRFGGDEFCVVLPETSAVGALEVAARLRTRIDSASLLVQEVGGVKLTASFGVASFPEHGASADALVVAADRAMQGVKAAGKNAVAMADLTGFPAGGEDGRPSSEPERGTE